MSDTCWFEMVVDREDVRKVNEVMFNTKDNLYWNEVIEDENDNTLTLISDEANYGYYNELKRLTEAKINFYGKHDSGSGYEAARFACFDGKYRGVATINDEPAALVGRDGISEASVKNIWEYYAIYDLVIAIFRDAI